MEHSHSWEANSSSAGEEIPRILCKPFARYRIHNIPPLAPLLNQMNPAHATITPPKGLY